MIKAFVTVFLFCLSQNLAFAQNTQDKGKETIGKVRATLYIGTNEDVAKLGTKLAPVDEKTSKRFQSIKAMRFDQYRMLGVDTQPVFRSYENWLAPLKPSEEILLSFESSGRSIDNGLRLDLEFWQQRRKVMKSNPTLYEGKPLLILGPPWRGGRLIISVELINLKK